MRRPAWAAGLVLLSLVAGSAAIARPAAQRGAILVVLSGAHELSLKGGLHHETGFYLNELMVPLKALMAAGYHPVFATPGGRRPALDASSDDPKYFEGGKKEYEEAKARLTSFGLLSPAGPAPKILEQVALEGAAAYAAIFVPGGHAPMIDLPRNAALGLLLRDFHFRKRPTALICHGPVALLSTVGDPGALADALEAGETEKAKKIAADWPYRDYKLTVFSDAEERGAEQAKLGGQLLFYPEDGLRAAGAVITPGPPGASSVIVDRELLTGQNPHSDREFAARFAELLRASR